MPVVIKAYTSPTLVLLAFDWAGGANRNDFLGFAIKRVPGFGNQPESWLPNRIDFNGPAPDGSDKPSARAPIQKFMWWTPASIRRTAGRPLITGSRRWLEPRQACSCSTGKPRC